MRSLIVLVGLSATLVACGTGDAVDPIQERVEQWAAENGVESVGVAVVTNGEVRSFGVGAGADARYQVGSLTKAVIAAVVLELDAEGELDLDDPVATWLAGFPSDLTVRDVLRHRSGLRDGGDSPPELSDLAGVLAPVEPEQLLVDAVGLVGDDRSPAYSNANYWVAGAVIEAVTGSALEDVIETRIAEPLDLDLTYGWVDAGDGVRGELVFGSTEVPFLADLQETLLTRAWAAGGIVASPVEMALFFDALFDDLLTAEGRSALTDTGPGSIYGLGVQDRGSGVWGHDGVLPGFTAAVVRPQEVDGATVVVVTNRMVVTVDGVTPDARAFAQELLATAGSG